MSKSYVAPVLGALALVVSSTGAWSQDARTPPGSTLTITLSGTAGPVLSGSDLGHVNGDSATVSILVSEKASPIAHTTNSATYKIPAGAITVTFNGANHQSTAPGRMKISLTKKGDILTVTGAFSLNGFPITVVDTSRLAKNSWTTAVLTHPGPFTPSPQNLKPATTASGPGSKIKYTITSFNQTTVLGITGTATSGSSADPVLPNDDAD